jgi:pimeloyl-ACP methyl ester carboxylesterase
MSHFRRTSARAACRVGLLAAATTLTGVTAASAAVPEFYVPPTTLPAQNGDLVRSQPQPLGVSIVIAGQPVFLPAKATKLMYKSTDEIGNPAAVTGVYLEPTKAWTGGGPRPLVSYAEGTQGQGDACAPSRTLQNTVVLESGQTALGYEVPSIYSLLDKGIAVVVTDYIGLGTSDRIHTYTNRQDMGHAVLDAARAALQVNGASVTASSPVGIYGYSQGGGASAAAAELQPSYAPEINLKAAYAGAPPADLFEVLKSADGTSLTGVIGYAINGILAYRPTLKPVLDAQTNVAGKSALWKVSSQCIGDTILSFGFKKTNEWTVSKTSAATVVSQIPAAMQAIDDQRIGKLKPTVPVQVLTGTLDDIVAHGQAKQLARDWCDKGANVYYAPVRQYVDSGGTSLNHLGPMLTSMSATQAWLVANLKGIRTPSNCGSLNTLP